MYEYFKSYVRVAERRGEEVLNHLREHPPDVLSRELSEEEADNEEVQEEEDDVRDVDEDLNFDPQAYVSPEVHDTPEHEQETSKPGRHRFSINGRNNFKWLAKAPRLQRNGGTSVAHGLSTFGSMVSTVFGKCIGNNRSTHKRRDRKKIGEYFDSQSDESRENRFDVSKNIIRPTPSSYGPRDSVVIYTEP